MTREKIATLLDVAYEMILAIIRLVVTLFTILFVAVKTLAEEIVKLLGETGEWVSETVRNAFGILVWMTPFLVLFEVAQRVNWNIARALYVFMASSWLILGLENMNRGGMVLTSLYILLVSYIMDIRGLNSLLFF